MGIESFYVNLLPENITRVQVESEFSNIGYIGDANVTISEFVNALSTEEIDCNPLNQHEYILNDSLYLTIHSEDLFVKEIALEGCFSWYENCAKEMYRVAILINNRILNVKLNFPNNRILIIPPDEQAFCQLIYERYRLKYEGFIETYGQIEVKCLPRNYFYSFIEKKSSKNIFGKIFKRR
ncbi:hypothetical protein K0T92_10520 [Paenibacillus oenotherae]|uniref:Uncharacterized protein n=1 Tax=Paenibacillus oenotherae TaxID=1435645 RepID=A0ABS7D6L0_9BACL|nr:hypothetical protein [Paenibacillus oenotherae]MBW7475182.1 hypothetical protein [Paenibacillus oenotherae]